jgi:PITH domain
VSRVWRPGLDVLSSAQGYREDKGLFLESDADEQILLHIHFTSAIKLSAITIAGPDDGHGPRGVKLFINRSTLGFAEAEDETGVQEFELEGKHLTGEPVQLRRVSHTFLCCVVGEPVQLRHVSHTFLCCVVG